MEPTNILLHNFCAWIKAQKPNTLRNNASTQGAVSMPKYFLYAPNENKIRIATNTDQLRSVTLLNTIHNLIKHKTDLSIFGQMYHNDETGHTVYNR
jgi:hypothetical protein